MNQKENRKKLKQKINLKKLSLTKIINNKLKLLHKIRKNKKGLNMIYAALPTHA